MVDLNSMDQIPILDTTTNHMYVKFLILLKFYDIYYYCRDMTLSSSTMKEISLLPRIVSYLFLFPKVLIAANFC